MMPDGDNWKPNGEHGARALRIVFRGHRPAVRLDDLFHDREPEPEASVRARGGRVGLPEWFEHVRKKLVRNALAAVAHDHLGGAVRRVQTHTDSSPFRCELDGARQ